MNADEVVGEGKAVVATLLLFQNHLLTKHTMTERASFSTLMLSPLSLLAALMIMHKKGDVKNLLSLGC